MQQKHKEICGDRAAYTVYLLAGEEAAREYCAANQIPYREAIWAIDPSPVTGNGVGRKLIWVEAEEKDQVLYRIRRTIAKKSEEKAKRIAAQMYLPFRECHNDYLLMREQPEVAKLIGKITYWEEEIERCHFALALPGREQVENDPDAHPDARGGWQRAEEDLRDLEKFLAQDMARLSAISN